MWKFSITYGDALNDPKKKDKYEWCNKADKS